MSKFRIIATPPGQAPEWVRRAWIGLELPMMSSSMSIGHGFQTGVLGGPADNIGGYHTDGKTAIDLLAVKNPKAARWWYNHAPQVLSMQLVFTKEVCVVS